MHADSVWLSHTLRPQFLDQMIQTIIPVQPHANGATAGMNLHELGLGRQTEAPVKGGTEKSFHFLGARLLRVDMDLEKIALPCRVHTHCDGVTTERTLQHRLG